jgi:cerevisin
MAIKDHYIVKLKDGAVNPANRTTWLKNTLNKSNATMLPGAWDTMKMGWSPEIMDGFSGMLGQEALAALRINKDVEYIAEDAKSWVTAIKTQTDAPWSLDRLSHKDRLNATADANSLGYEYKFDDKAGTGVDIYIIDTGVRVTHDEFEGRAIFATTFGPGTPDQDLHGHGTHCAGIAASRAFGVAKNASIIAIKVMDDQGTGQTSDIISGISFAVRTALAKQPRRPSVISISIISPGSAALDSAVQSALDQGVHVVVGAGNDNVDAKDFSPARAPNAITVGATDVGDARASFSNFGAGVDIFAPGVTITSTYKDSDTSEHVLSGTSMATPLVAGTVAYLLSTTNPKATPDQMKTALITLADKGAITDLPSGTVNLLVFNGVSATAASSPGVALGAANAAANNNGTATPPALLPGTDANKEAQQKVLAGFLGSLRFVFPSEN